MRITTWNVNGLRAAIRKGIDRFVDQLAPDVLMLQEIRCTPEQLGGAWTPSCGLPPADWHVHWHAAARLGYAGVVTWSRAPIEVLGTGLDGEDPEGRVLSARVGGVRVVNVYLPSGAAGPERQAAKEAWMARFLPWAARLAALPEPVVLGGDLNIAHTENDIHDPRRGSKISGFLPHEREWFTRLLATGWTDTVRRHFGDRKGPYSWWSNFGKAREQDRGWRIDYLLANAAAAERVADAGILREGGLVVSDHAPVWIELR